MSLHFIIINIIIVQPVIWSINRYASHSSSLSISSWRRRERSKRVSGSKEKDNWQEFLMNGMMEDEGEEGGMVTVWTLHVIKKCNKLNELSPTYTEQLCCWQLVVRPLMWLSNTGQHVAESRETGNFWQQVASPHQRHWQQSCSVYVGLYSVSNSMTHKHHYYTF